MTDTEAEPLEHGGLTKSWCESCGHQKDVCPECGGKHVTPMDNPETRKPNDIVAYGGSGEWQYTNICWDCGWKETVTVDVSREVGYAE